MHVCTETGETVGVVTSGTASPLTKKKISMGYVPKALGKVGTPLQVRACV
jgi:glycine cleavage system aminomethyltransferase T